METYKFLKKTYSEDSVTRYFAISSDRIETLRVSSTYTNYGQMVDTSDAGDSVTLDSQKAVDIANKAYYEHTDEDEKNRYELEDFVLDYDDPNTFSAVSGSSELVEGVDYTYNAETCKGFNYWDGNNWASVIVEYENGSEEAPFEIVSDEDLIKELNNAIEEKTYVKNEFGEKIYHSGKYKVTYSQFASSWEDYCLIHLDEIED